MVTWLLDIKHMIVTNLNPAFMRVQFKSYNVCKRL